MVSKKQFLKDYDIIKSSAQKYFEKGNIADSLKCIEICGRLAYHFNLFYCDEELEKLIRLISAKTVGLPPLRPVSD